MELLIAIGVIEVVVVFLLSAWAARSFQKKLPEEPEKATLTSKQKAVRHPMLDIEVTPASAEDSPEVEGTVELGKLSAEQAKEFWRFHDQTVSVDLPPDFEALEKGQDPFQVSPQDAIDALSEFEERLAAAEELSYRVANLESTVQSIQSAEMDMDSVVRLVASVVYKYGPEVMPKSKGNTKETRAEAADKLVSMISFVLDAKKPEAPGIG